MKGELGNRSVSFKRKVRHNLNGMGRPDGHGGGLAIMKVYVAQAIVVGSVGDLVGGAKGETARAVGIGSEKDEAAVGADGRVATGRGVGFSEGSYGVAELADAYALALASGAVDVAVMVEVNV